jgi:hypothetical protein
MGCFALTLTLDQCERSEAFSHEGSVYRREHSNVLLSGDCESLCFLPAHGIYPAKKAGEIPLIDSRIHQWIPSRKDPAE